MYSYCSATLTEVFPCFFLSLRQMPGYNSPRRGTARTVPIYFCVVLCIFFLCCSVYCLCVNVYCTAAVLFVCKCVLYCCHRVATQLQLTNISYHVMSCKPPLHSTPKCDVRTHFQLNVFCRLRYNQYTGHHGC
jgi:hypothetical protein